MNKYILKKAVWKSKWNSTGSKAWTLYKKIMSNSGNLLIKSNSYRIK